MSQASAISHAPARHAPRTAAMVGLDSDQNRMVAWKSLSRISRHACWPLGRRSICSLRSKPEEKLPLAPVTTSTRTAWSASTMSQTRSISPSIAPLSAFMRSGRCRVRTPTSPCVS